MLMSAAKWKQIPDNVQRVVRDEIARSSAADVADIRKADERSCRNLLERGYQENAWTGEARKEADGELVRAAIYL
jgi:TRAP-type C4-dicarboxylate transport system substrate-binding protein